jgi:hypothetical protein
MRVRFAMRFVLGVDSVLFPMAPVISMPMIVAVSPPTAMRASDDGLTVDRMTLTSADGESERR